MTVHQTPVTCPDARHRSSTGCGWRQFGALGRCSSRFGYSRCSHSAPLPGRDAARYIIAIVVGVDTEVTNGFLRHRPSSSRR